MVEVTVQELTSRVSLVGTYYGDVELNMVYVKDSVPRLFPGGIL